MRLKIIRLIVIGLFIVIAGALFYVQVVRGGYYHHLSVNNRIRVVPLEGWRGRIKDRKGRLLADNKVSYDVMVTPQDIKNIQELFKFLSSILDVDQKVLIKNVPSEKIYAIYAGRHCPKCRPAKSDHC